MQHLSRLNVRKKDLCDKRMNCGKRNFYSTDLYVSMIHLLDTIHYQNVSMLLCDHLKIML